jgi:hypothetical protein
MRTGGLSLAAQIILSIPFPVDFMHLPGVRAADDTTAWLFILYPFLVAFAAGFLYDFVHKSLPGKTKHMKGIYFGGFLFLIETLPTMVLVFTTMVYPTNFYLHGIIRGAVAYACLGILFTKIWKEK